MEVAEAGWNVCATGSAADFTPEEAAAVNKLLEQVRVYEQAGYRIEQTTTL